jgi:endonuclease/exonuclease/phosphatase family metal-dependent hydrolase
MPVTFTVGTFNVGGLMTGTNYQAGASREDIARGLYRWFQHVDIVLLQEVYRYFGNQLDLLRGSYPFAEWTPTAPFRRGLYTGMGGMAVISRYPLTFRDRVVYWPSGSDPNYGATLFWVSANIGGRTVHLFTSHYPHTFYGKLAGSRVALTRIRRVPADEPIVFGADFNSGSYEPEVGMLLSGGPLEIVADYLGAIDIVLARGTRRLHQAVIDKQVAPHLTDHPLVFAGLEVIEGKSKEKEKEKDKEHEKDARKDRKDRKDLPKEKDREQLGPWAEPLDQRLERIEATVAELSRRIPFRQP